MAVSVIGINHKSSPIEIRELLAFNEKTVPEILKEILRFPEISETVLLSTCNRTEIYISTPDQEAGIRRIENFLCEKSKSHISQIKEGLYHYSNAEAARHLFQVAAGMDSLVVGEKEILHQTKRAYILAHNAKATKKTFNILFQKALSVGKLVRTETNISEGSVSVGSVAVKLAEMIYGSLQDVTVMVFGAGEIAERCVKFLVERKVKSLIVSNRHYERAEELAKQFGGEALKLEEGLEKIKMADVILCSTSAPNYLIKADSMKEIMHFRRDRSLFFIDLSVPRNIDPAINEIDNIYLYNIDDLESMAKEHLQQRKEEAAKAEKVIEQVFQKFMESYGSLF